jgi:hypothetical protein
LARPCRKQRQQQITVVLASDRRFLEADTLLFRQPPFPVIGIDDRDLRSIAVEMPEDEWQCATADRAEPDHDDGAVDPTKKLSGHAGTSICGSTRDYWAASAHAISCAAVYAQVWRCGGAVA